MSAPRSTGGARRRVRAAAPPDPLPPRVAPANPPDSRRRPHPRAEALEPRRMLATFTVTTDADAGPGSLRQAILDANATAGSDTIEFAIPGDGGAAHTIRPQTPLPAITDALAVNATTQPGYAGSPQIELDGSAAGADADGFTVLARPVDVVGFAINRFSRDGIVVRAPRTSGSTADSQIRILNNFIGTDVTGSTARSNGGDGVGIYSENVLVGNAAANRNVISGNRGSGVRAAVSSGTAALSVRFNYIGTNAAGDAAIPNGASGIRMEAGFVLVSGNVISGNPVNGVYSTATRNGAIIENNSIGTDASGTRAIPNGSAPADPLNGGIIAAGLSSLTVRNNTVSGNRGQGISLANSAGNVIGNRIGTDASGRFPLGNSGDGIHVEGGRPTSFVSNTVCASGGDGIRLTGVVADATTRTVLQLNFVGTNSSCAAGLGNRGNGITLDRCRNIDVGYSDGDDVFFNAIGFIGANGGHGIFILGALSGTQDAMGLRIFNNEIGFRARHRVVAKLPNGGSGICLVGASGVTIISNTISANGGDGITIEDLDGRPTTGVDVFSNAIGGTFPGSNFVATPAPGNRGNGVLIINSFGNRIGSLDGAGNLIRANADAGVRVTGNTSRRNLIASNGVASNGGLGIDLGGEGVTPNDELDVDSGPNDLQNAPAITNVMDDGIHTTVGLRLRSEPGRTYRVELFASVAADPSGLGEGEKFLGFATLISDASGEATGSVSIPSASLPRPGWLTATATDAEGNTSEFSPAVSAASLRPAYRPARPGLAPPTSAPLAAQASSRRRSPDLRDLLN